MKLTDDQAAEAHKRYLADRRHTVRSLAAELGCAQQTLSKRWAVLSLEHERVGRGICLDREQVAAARLEVERAPLLAARRARGLTPAGELRADLARAAWLRYPVERAEDLAAEIGWGLPALLRAWKLLGHEPKKTYRAAKSKRDGPITARLHARVSSGQTLEEAAAALGLSVSAARNRLWRLKMKMEVWAAVRSPSA